MAKDSRFELVTGAPPRFGLVCFRLACGTEEDQVALLQEINGSGEMFLVHTKRGGRYVLRLAVGGTYTQQVHVDRAWEAIGRAADAVEVHEKGRK